MEPNPATSPERAAEPLRTLVVAADARVGRDVAALLADADAGERFAVETAGDVDEAVERLAAVERGDDGDDTNTVVVLALPFPERPGIVPFVDLRARSGDVPIIVLCDADDEPFGLKAVQLGASDYLIREQLYGILVARCLRHAVEAERVRSLLARTQASAPRFEDPEKDPAAKPASLRTALPERFAELVEAYGRCLDEAVEQVLYRVEYPIADALREVAAAAAELRATPRDVVELHTAAIRARSTDLGPQRTRIYGAEGSLRLLELMGYLAAYYRAACLSAEP